MINRVVLVGRLARDPELRRTSNGTAVSSFTIAVDNFRSKNSNNEKTASFIPCTIWNQQAENLVKYIKKGGLVGVEGRLMQRTYDRKDGTKANVVEVLCDSVSFLESKNSNNVQSATNGYESDNDNNIDNNNLDTIDIVDDDLPF